MVDSTHLNITPRNSQLAWSFLVSAIFVVALCFLFEPRWETNDDVGMSMVAHGYGIAAVGMPNLVFSNVIWGYLVRAIPQINGVLGYSIAAVGVLVFVGTALLHVLRQLGFGWLVSLSLLTLLLARPVLFPQFTINAGLLTVGAIACWHLYGRNSNRRALLIGCLFAFCGYLVRSREFLLVLLIALPLLPWVKLARDRTAQTSALALLLAIGGAALVDFQAYQGDDWHAFNALNPARTPITDFGAGVLLKNNPEILARYGYTQNDINLLSSWFFVDPNLANPTSLNAMVKELGPLPFQSHSFMNGWLGIKALAHSVLLPEFLAALLLLLMLPSRRLFLIWALGLVAIFVLGMMGRPGILRVYIPVLSLLLIAPLLLQGYKATGQRQYFVMAVIVVAGFFNTNAVFSESRAAQMESEMVRRDLQGFPEDVVVVWGSAFPFEAMYPVLKQSESIMAYKLFGLGVFTLAPFSVSYAESTAGRGMIERLVSENGVPILGSNHLFGLLKIYCQERLGGTLVEVANKQYGQRNVSWRRCDFKVAQ